MDSRQAWRRGGPRTTSSSTCRARLHWPWFTARTAVSVRPPEGVRYQASWAPGGVRPSCRWTSTTRSSGPRRPCSRKGSSQAREGSVTRITPRAPPAGGTIGARKSTLSPCSFARLPRDARVAVTSASQVAPAQTGDWPTLAMTPPWRSRRATPFSASWRRSRARISRRCLRTSSGKGFAGSAAAALRTVGKAATSSASWRPWLSQRSKASLRSSAREACPACQYSRAARLSSGRTANQMYVWLAARASAAAAAATAQRRARGSATPLPPAR